MTQEKNMKDPEWLKKQADRYKAEVAERSRERDVAKGELRAAQGLLEEMRSINDHLRAEVEASRHAVADYRRMQEVVTATIAEKDAAVADLDKARAALVELEAGRVVRRGPGGALLLGGGERQQLRRRT